MEWLGKGEMEWLWMLKKLFMLWLLLCVCPFVSISSCFPVAFAFARPELASAAAGWLRHSLAL